MAEGFGPCEKGMPVEGDGPVVGVDGPCEPGVVVG